MKESDGRNKGWVKLHRSIGENVFLMQDDTCYLLFTKLLFSVSPTKGELAGGRKQLAGRFNLSEYVFYRAIKRLEVENMVHSKSHSKYTVYTICNWHKYQDKPAQTSAHGAHNTRTTPAHSLKNKNKNKKSGIDAELAAKETQARSRTKSGAGYERAVSVRETLSKKR